MSIHIKKYTLVLIELMMVKKKLMEIAQMFINDKWISEMCYILSTMGCYLTSKMNEVLIHTTSLVNLENIRLSEESRHTIPHIV